MTIQSINSSDPNAHVQKDPKAQALFETTAEVLGGLEKAFHDFQSGNEEAWKKT